MATTAALALAEIVLTVRAGDRAGRRVLRAPCSLPRKGLCLMTSSYSVTIDGVGALGPVERTGLSHAEAMKVAESLRGDDKIVRVMHVVGDKAYEVDRYPVR